MAQLFTGNDETESQLKRDCMMAKNEFKMLLLGARESRKVRRRWSLVNGHQIKGNVLLRGVTDAIGGLWCDLAALRACSVAQHNSAFCCFERMATPGYIPRDQVILRSRHQQNSVAFGDL